MTTKLTRSGDSVHVETPDMFRTLTVEQFAKHARDPSFCADLPAERAALVSEQAAVDLAAPPAKAP